MLHRVVEYADVWVCSLFLFSCFPRGKEQKIKYSFCYSTVILIYVKPWFLFLPKKLHRQCCTSNATNYYASLVESIAKAFIVKYRVTDRRCVASVLALARFH
jgi:hypothetical protein